MTKKYLLIFSICALVVLIGSSGWNLMNKKESEEAQPPQVTPSEIASSTPEIREVKSIIGNSVEGRSIESYTFGTGSTSVIFVGGIHGGYEWNSSLLAYEFIEALENKTMEVPEGFTVHVIPSINPDGLFSVIGKVGKFTGDEIPPNNAHTTGAGRFNANDVDLNRNFDCKWQPESSWRSKQVSAGTAPFSEPEAAALRDFVLKKNPAAVVFWHSQANTVYASECLEGVLPLTSTLMYAYAKAADYNAVESFDAYPITGDAEGWLATLGIPAITVELETRTESEWVRNRMGIEALFVALSLAQ
jgi:hypothetical protein